LVDEFLFKIKYFRQILSCVCNVKIRDFVHKMKSRGIFDHLNQQEKTTLQNFALENQIQSIQIFWLISFVSCRKYFQIQLLTCKVRWIRHTAKCSELRSHVYP